MYKRLSYGSLNLGGMPVEVPSTADIAPSFRSGSNNALLQAALDRINSNLVDGLVVWRQRNAGPTLELMLRPEDGVFYADVVKVQPGERRLWGVYVYHSARYPGLSPFIMPSGELPVASRITVELAGSVQRPSLVRAYLGGYRPPLPWMKSANYSSGGTEASLTYWQGHAYVCKDGIVKGSLTDRAPEWYRVAD